MTINDAHVHFFSAGFFRAFRRDLEIDGDPATLLPQALGWDPPGSDVDLAARWVAELDRHHVSRALLIASTPDDESSVATAILQYPTRIVGGFMVDPAGPDPTTCVERGLRRGLSTVCLFPAMHHVALDDPRTRFIVKMAGELRGTVFVHCGALSIGVRKKLGLPSTFDLRLGDPLAVAALAVRHPEVPMIIPHFGAGMFRETLMAAEAASNILIDTSSSNRWIRWCPGLTLKDVFARALDVVGPSRLLFGTDSSFFPRGWQRGIYDEQCAILTDLGVDGAAQAMIRSENFDRVFRTGLERNGIESIS